MSIAGSNAIEIESVWKRFHKRGGESLLWETLAAPMRRMLQCRQPAATTFWALQNVSLQCRRGEAVGIIGPNGAGKSTLLKILSRVLRPDRGGVHVNGRLSGLIEVGAGFHGDLTGRENIFVNGAILGMSRREIREKFDRIVEFAGIGEFLDMPVKRYSSGMYVRLGFSVAAHMEPDVLLVDEVLSVGDVSFKARCMDAMRGFMRRGTSILFVSHNLSAIKRFCDRVILLDHGQVRCDGPADAAIAEYSRLVSAMEEANPSGLEGSHIGGRSAGSKGARVTAVRIFDNIDRLTSTFVAGEPLRMEIDYEIDQAATIRQLNVAISVHMFGAGRYYQFESLRDGLNLSVEPGCGTVMLMLPHLSLGEGVYQIGVALADDKGLPEHDWHDRAYRIQVVSDGLTDGVVHQTRTWSIAGCQFPIADSQEGHESDSQKLEIGNRKSEITPATAEVAS